MYLLYSRRSQPTGTALGNVLQIPSGQDPAVTDLLIRWGNSSNEYCEDGCRRVINSSGAIRNAADKLFALESMKESGVLVPDFDTDPEALLARVGYPILGRRRTHARGTDIKLVLQRRDYSNLMHHYTQYIPTVREFRIHVVGNEVIRVQGKYLDNASEAKAHIRNYTTGYRFRAPRRRLRQDRLDSAVKAVECLGLDFGAVDLIVADDGNGYVLEVNTAPACSPLTLGAYAVALQKLAGIETIDMSHLDLLDSDAEEMDSEDEGGDE